MPDTKFLTETKMPENPTFQASSNLSKPVIQPAFVHLMIAPHLEKGGLSMTTLLDRMMAVTSGLSKLPLPESLVIVTVLPS